MPDITNPLQNTSYTNKDFTSVYVELLDLVKDLTSVWDPSISNESDPGVILLKLNAIIADKLAYNSDTNVLETFPLSVTQEKNARQLFEQLGYYMHWYIAASTSVSITWTGIKDASTEYTIPAFTMVADYDNNIIYSLVGPTTLDGSTAVGDQKLKLDGSAIAFKALQGIPVEFEINGETLITINHLDSNNRVYFSTSDVAENGIFITNDGTANYSDWKKVDNLLVQNVSPTSYFYKFGVIQDTNTCYIEFPENAEELIKNGIRITYIKTLGEDGNIAYKTIEKFYDEFSPEEASDVIFTVDNVNVFNTAAAIDGANPQTINSAYKGYKSTSGVFDTLVTLRDYMSYILNSGLVSNCFVCDRTNDLQSTYQIVTNVNGADSWVTEIESVPNTLNTPELTAFDLKLYLLQKPSDIIGTDPEKYSNTFVMLDYASQANVRDYIRDAKCISHDYTELLPYTTDSSHFCYFINEYPINCKVVTQYRLTKVEAKEVEDSIRTALYRTLNAAEVTFGEEVSYDLIHDTILEADKRIKTVMLDNLEYTTYAVCYNSVYNVFTKTDISSIDEEPIQIVLDKSATFTCSVNEEAFTKAVNMSYESFEFTFDGTNWHLAGQSENVNLSDYGITISGEPVGGQDYIIASISPTTQFKDEIWAKSILAGTTQFLVQDEEFDYQLPYLYDKSTTDICSRVKAISTNLDVPFGEEEAASGYKLRDNETIQLFAPSVLDGTVYSTYVKFEYNLNSDLISGEKHQLQSGEYFIMYWKEYETDTLYKYAVYGEGNIIQLTSFDLLTEMPNITHYGTDLLDYMYNLGTDSDPIMYTDSTMNNRMSFALSEKVKTITNSIQILSSVKQITIKELNQVTLESGNAFCYWILNEKYTVDKEQYYKLFADGGEYSYLLNSNEYFIYTDSTLTNLTILGAGTLLRRSSNRGDWIVNVKDASDIVVYGINAFDMDEWFQLYDNDTLTITEQEYKSLSSGSTLFLELDSKRPGNRPKYMTATIDTTTTTPGLGAVLEDSFKFLCATEGYGSFSFTYEQRNNTTAWWFQGKPVSLSLYGITIDAQPALGNVISVVAYPPNLLINNEGVWNLSPQPVPVLPIISPGLSTSGGLKYVEFGSSIGVYKEETNSGTQSTAVGVSSPSYPVAAVYLVGNRYVSPASLNLQTGVAYQLTGCKIPTVGELTASIVESTASSDTTLDPSTFIHKVIGINTSSTPIANANIYGDYVFRYDSGWKLGDQSVTMSQYGITNCGTSGTIIVKIPYPYRIRVSIDHHSPSEPVEEFCDYGWGTEFTVAKASYGVTFIIEAETYKQTLDPETYTDSFPSVYTGSSHALAFSPLCTLVDQPPQPVNPVPEKITLKDFKISYQPANDNQRIDIQALDLTYDEYAWNARTLLALNISPTLKQRLEDRQSVMADLQGIYFNDNPRQVGYPDIPVYIDKDQAFTFTHAADGISVTITATFWHDGIEYREWNADTRYLEGTGVYVVQEVETVPTLVYYKCTSDVNVPGTPPAEGSAHWSSVTVTPYEIKNFIYDQEEGKAYVNGKESSFVEVSQAGAIQIEGLYNQKVIEGASFSGEDNENWWPVTLFSNPELVIDGGQKLSTYQYNNDMEIQYLKLFQFKDKTSYGRGIYIDPNQNVIIEFFRDLYDTGSTYTYTREMQICLPAGEYILPLEVGSNLADPRWGYDLNVTYNNKVLHAMNSESLTDFNEAKHYFVYLVSNGEPGVLKFIASGADKLPTSVALKVSNIFRYHYKEDMSSFMVDKMLFLISKLDKNNLYNYMYKVNPDEEIPDPTMGKYFFQSNHIYNPFTIPKISSTKNINILGKK